MFLPVGRMRTGGYRVNRQNGPDVAMNKLQFQTKYNLKP